MRVYEIAKEVGIPNKDLIAKIRALGLEVNNHMSSLDADDVARIKRSIEKEKQSVASPQQTQVVSPTGTVLRRRSSGDKAASSGSEERSVERAPVAPPAPAAPAPVIRRRVVAEEPAAPVTPPAPPPVAPAPPVAPPVAAAPPPPAVPRTMTPPPRP